MTDLIKFLLCVAFVACNIPLADAEVLYNSLTLLNDVTFDAGETTSAITFPASIVPVRPIGLACRAQASNVSGTNPTLDLQVLTCKDTTLASCVVICSFSQCTASGAACWVRGSESIDLSNTTVYPYFRVIGVLGGTTPVFNVTVDIDY